MAHSNNGTPPGSAAHLPVTRLPAEDAADFVPAERTRPLADVREIADSLGRPHPSSNASVGALTDLVCTGATPADALQAAADIAGNSPTLEPHGLALERVPGPVVGVWEYQLVMTVSTRTPQAGADEAPAHHFYRLR